MTLLKNKKLSARDQEERLIDRILSMEMTGIKPENLSQMEASLYKHLSCMLPSSHEKLSDVLFLTAESILKNSDSKKYTIEELTKSGFLIGIQRFKDSLIKERKLRELQKVSTEDIGVCK